VTGKFFSALTVFVITLAVSFIYPVILSILGTPNWGEIMTGYLGLLFFGGALISVGMFISSLTQSQVTAAVATLGVMLAILLAETMIPQIGNEFIRTTLSKSTLSYNFYFFQRGIFSLQSIVYFFSFIIFFLFLTSRMIERRRWAKG
jgi:ABC-2 type transport system permease protein